MGATGPTIPTFVSSYTSVEEPEFLPVEDKGLAIEPIIGLRSYYAQVEDMCLLSHNGIYWPKREPLRAHCEKDYFAAHEVPSEDCDCGVYAWPQDATDKMVGNVYGEVYLWGDVLVCEYGYRAEIAYPKSLTIKAPAATRAIRRLRDGLEEGYGVPVTVSLGDPNTDQPF